jgi:PAS domain S-box-containing protein
MIAGGASLTDILDNLCRTIDAQAAGTIATVLLMDADGRRLWPAAGPRVPAGWTRAITPLEIGPSVGSCGTAAYLKKPVIVSDIESNPLFADVGDGAYRDLALSYGLRASWSQPIISKNNEVLGTFAMYFAEPRSPSDSDLELIRRAGQVALIAIERKHAEDELRRSEAYLAEAQRLSLTGSFGWKVSSGELFWSKETFCILGYDQATKPTLELVLNRVHSEDLAFVQTTIDRASRDGTNVDFEHRLLFPDGSVKHVHVMAHTVRDESGKLEFVGAVSDVTAAKLAEEKIRQDEKELRRIVDLIPQVVIVTGPDGTPLYANRVMLDYTGVSPEQVPSAGFGGRLSHPEDVEEFRALR